jgi:hypothetical protein
MSVDDYIEEVRKELREFANKKHTGNVVFKVNMLNGGVTNVNVSQHMKIKTINI